MLGERGSAALPADWPVVSRAVADTARGCACRVAAENPPPLWWYGHAVELGLHKQALEVAERNRQAHRRARAFAAVSEAMSHGAPCQQAALIAGRAGQEANKVTDPWIRADCQAEAALALAATGSGTLLESITLALSIGEDRSRVRALCGIACTAAKTGSAVVAGEVARQASAAAEEAGFPGTRPDALAAAAAALVAAGLGDEGRAVAAQIQDPWARAEAFVSVAMGVPDTGALAEALSAATAVNNTIWRAEAQAAVVEAMCRLGDQLRAMATAETIQDPVWRAEALLAIAAVSDHETAMSMADRAVRLGRTVGYPWWQAGRIARVLACLFTAAPRDRRPLEWGCDARVLISALRMPLSRDGFRAVVGALEPIDLTDWLACDLLASCARTWPELAVVFRDLAT
jgi:hypothetical protein